MLSTIIKIVSRLISIIICGFAFLLWLTREAPDCNIFKLGGCGFFDIGFYGYLSSNLSWLIICIIGAIGASIWELGNWLAEKIAPASTYED